jgi:hypothetical protein
MATSWVRRPPLNELRTNSEAMAHSQDLEKVKGWKIKWVISFSSLHTWTVSFPIVALVSCLAISIALHFEVRLTAIPGRAKTLMC